RLVLAGIIGLLLWYRAPLSPEYEPWPGEYGIAPKLSLVHAFEMRHTRLPFTSTISWSISALRPDQPCWPPIEPSSKFSKSVKLLAAAAPVPKPIATSAANVVRCTLFIRTSPLFAIFLVRYCRPRG